MKITAYTSYNDYTNTHSRRDFELVTELPSIRDRSLVNDVYRTVIHIDAVTLDCEQGSDDVWKYDYFAIEYNCENEDGDAMDDEIEYICIPKRRYELTAKFYNASATLFCDDDWGTTTHYDVNFTAGELECYGNPTLFDDVHSALEGYKDDLLDDLSERFAKATEESINNVIDRIMIYVDGLINAMWEEQ